MASSIKIQKRDATHFHVRVKDGGSETAHEITLDSKDLARLGGGSVAAETLIQKSFEFLLEREPKESILGSFNLTVISRYFPDYEREIRKRLAAG